MLNAKIEKNTIFINMNGKYESYADFQEKNRNHRIGIVEKMNTNEVFFAEIKQIHIRNKNRKPMFDIELGWTHRQ